MASEDEIAEFVAGALRGRAAQRPGDQAGQ
jgi:hypothetical protein